MDLLQGMNASGRINQQMGRRSDHIVSLDRKDHDFYCEYCAFGSEDSFTDSEDYV